MSCVLFVVKSLLRWISRVSIEKTLLIESWFCHHDPFEYWLAPNATYFGSGRARALRSCEVNSNVYRAARAAPLQENNYFGFERGGIGLAPEYDFWADEQSKFGLS